MNTYLGRTAIGAIVAATLCAPAYAQVSENEDGSIVVTAQRREQNAQDVGIALSVIGSDELEQRGVTNVNQLQDATPSLEIEPAFGGGAAQFRLRGVGFQDYASNNSPTVGVYVNEVAYPVPVMTQGLIFDVARVEVLRGPQGTLYGRNTTGGAVNFTTNKPTDQFTAGGMVEYGRFDALRGEAHVSGPLTEGINLRVSGATQQGGAYQYNRDTGEEIGDANRWAGRALLAIEPVGSGFSGLLDFHYGRDKSDAIGLYLLNDLPTRAGSGPVIPADTDRFATGWGLSPQLLADTELSVGDVPGVDNETWGVSGNLSYDFGSVTLTSVTAYDWLHREQFGDWDSSASVEADTFFGSDVDVFAQEVRLGNSQPGPLTWVVGAYYSQQNLDERYYSDFVDVYGTYARVNYAQKVESISGFGQLEYAFSPRFKAIAGLRYEYEKRQLQGFGSAFGGAQALPPTDVATSMKPLTGKLAFEFTPSDDLLLYASASKGTKSGGFTTYNTGNESGIEPFAPETLYAYEVGFKANPSRTFQINGSFFYYDYRDQQVLSAVWGDNGAVGRFANAPKSSIWGTELEVVITPIEGVTLTQYVGYKKGRYLEFFDLDVPASNAVGEAVYTDRAHTDIPFPNLSLGGSMRYAIPMGDYTLTPSATYFFREEYPSWLGETFDIAAYFVVNAEVQLTPTNGPWTLSLWGRNIFNEEYDLTRNYFTSADIAQPARPVSYGVRFSIDY
ncbi:TonB-dependent receptor [Novosphingobium sp. BW1]|uniref:TonB-dependent receptor n=1 Tax=Novosphingobium sp. BW1 TaxID=2592621 RepID=UPI0011DE70AA|nr:TonB-dependent receptor [Novosphingobium sp. BW1]TYC90480.1 TonB-dependent receptor [Novosphingobium sp. BW1]